MLGTSQIFSTFPRLNRIPITDIAKWIRKAHDFRLLENYLANKLLYPQIIPTTGEEVEVDLAILREALKAHRTEYYRQTPQKILMPKFFLAAIHDLRKLAWAFIDAFQPEGVCQMVLKEELGWSKSVVVGSVIRPSISSLDGNITLWVDGKKYDLRIGSLVVIPAPESKVNVKFVSKTAKLIGKDSLEIEMSGGKLGLMVDLRIGQHATK